MNYKIKDLPLDERPREKLRERGSGTLSNEELIAILLRCGNKNESVKDLSIRLIKELNHFHELNVITYEDLIKIKGIKEAKAITLLAAIELGKRLSMPKEMKKIKVTNAEDIFHIFRIRMGSLKQEMLIAVFLNTKNEIIKDEIIFIGTQNKSLTHPREIFHAAINASAVKILLIHNHPTNDVSPSKEDILFTKNIKEAGLLLQIPLMDHVIIGETKFFSFFDHQML